MLKKALIKIALLYSIKIYVVVYFNLFWFFSNYLLIKLFLFNEK